MSLTLVAMSSSLSASLYQQILDICTILTNQIIQTFKKYSVSNVLCNYKVDKVFINETNSKILRNKTQGKFM